MARAKAGFRKLSQEAVLKGTGKGWKHWFAVLDKWDVQKNGHTASAKYLLEKHGISAWWAQAVTIRYEWERGLRK